MMLLILIIQSKFYNIAIIPYNALLIYYQGQSQLLFLFICTEISTLTDLLLFSNETTIKNV